MTNDDGPLVDFTFKKLLSKSISKFAIFTLSEAYEILFFSEELEDFFGFKIFCKS